MSKRMMKMPRDVGVLHIVGIGGIGMSGIAEALNELGYEVQGSDIAESANVKRLREKGIKVMIGHAPENLEHADILVVSSAIKPDNPELREARRRHLPVVKRAEMLVELMRFRNGVAVAGTHGKTTTTSLVGELLAAGGLDPTIINGGIIQSLKTNVRLGKGEWMVVEADESDGTFLRLPADVAVITNIDPEHLDFWGDFDSLRAAFRRFVENIPFYGFAVACSDHEEVQHLIADVRDRRIISYGTNPQADARVHDIRVQGGRSVFSVTLADRRRGEVIEFADLELPMPGQHNVLNATAALVVAHELGVKPERIRAGLAGFTGVGRRFTFVGEWRGVRIYDDYGHHPVEIAAVLKAARQVADKGRLIAVMQPHRYTRLDSLFDAFASCFTEADSVLVAPVYAAGEQPIEGRDHATLAEAMLARGQRDVHVLPEAGPGQGMEQVIAPLLRRLAAPGDVVIFLGAGNITQWAHAMPDALEAADAD